MITEKSFRFDTATITISTLDGVFERIGQDTFENLVHGLYANIRTVDSRLSELNRDNFLDKDMS